MLRLIGLLNIPLTHKRKIVFEITVINALILSYVLLASANTEMSANFVSILCTYTQSGMAGFHTDQLTTSHPLF